MGFESQVPRPIWGIFWPLESLIVFPKDMALEEGQRREVRRVGEVCWSTARDELEFIPRRIYSVSALLQTIRKIEIFENLRAAGPQWV